MNALPSLLCLPLFPTRLPLSRHTPSGLLPSDLHRIVPARESNAATRAQNPAYYYMADGTFQTGMRLLQAASHACASGPACAPMPVSPLAFGAPNARGRSVSNWSPLFGPLLRDLPLVSAPACASLQVGACPLFCLQLTGGMTCALLRGPAQMFLLAPTARHSSTHVQTVYSRGTATHGVGLPGPPSPARARALATPGARHVAPSAPAAGLPPRAQPRPSLSVPGRSRQLPQQLGPEAAALGTPARARRHTPNNTRVASPWDWAVPSP
jgi:hypothetical protein